MVEPELAVEVARLFSPNRLRLARETRSLTQTELSRQIDMTAAAVSQFEKADTKPSAATVTRLAEALSFPVSFFATSSAPSSRSDDDIDHMDGYGHFRSLRSVTAKQRREALSVTQLVRDVVHAVSTRVRLPDLSVPRLPADGEDLVLAEECAGEVRRAWSVPPGPVVDVMQLAERHGVVAARHPTATPKVAAFSVPFPERPVVVIRQQGAKRDRDRFSLSHEIGHMAMHRADKILAPKTVESQAHRFAAAFLMPADEIRGELPSKPDWVRLLTLKQEWQVSLGALIHRARDLAVMDESTYTQAMRTMSIRGWRVDEPGDLGVAEPPRLLARAMGLGRFTSAELAAETGWPADLVEEVVQASTDTRPHLEL